jgi:hypothetical protein
MIDRRKWLQTLAVALAAAAQRRSPQAMASIAMEPTTQTPSSAPALALAEYEPRSMLHAQETRVERAKFPVIDVHTHITVSAKSEKGIDLGAERTFLAKPDELLGVMDAKNIRAMVNLTGGFDDGLTDTIRKYDSAFPWSLLHICRAHLLSISGTQLSSNPG